MDKELKMCIKSLKENSLLGYSTSRASLLTYPITPVNDLNMSRIYNLINEVKEITCEMLEEQPKIINYPVTEHCFDRIEINHDDFVNFKNHLESEEVFENPKLIHLFEDYFE